MERLSIKLNDLSDEILIYVLKKLYNVEVLYSLIGVNKQLNRIAHDFVFTSHLRLYLLNDVIYPLPDSMLDRFCLKILPSIHDKIEWLYLESTSMKRILRATHYPNLYGLGLYDIDVEKAISLFTDDTDLIYVDKNQISSLIIDISKNKKPILRKDINAMIFKNILTMFINLQYLNFGPSPNFYQRFSFDDMSSQTIICSNLLELHISVYYFTDLLYLLDGRFNQLQTLYVNIHRIKGSSSTISSEEKLANLKCFCLYSDMRTQYYDTLIIILLHRMLNLEKLDLHLKLDRNKGFIDGNDLKENILNKLTRLNKFTFNIRVLNHISNQINLPSNQDIQETFKDFKDNQIISCIDLFEEKQYRYCHIYSYPYRMIYYDNISNNFPGGLFKNVHRVELYDEYPFEYEFFIRIQKSFPFMKELTIINDKPQKNKLYRISNNDNQDLSIIKYPHLIHLDLLKAHDDYIEQFLVDTEMSLSNYVSLVVYYEAIKRVTENFTRNTTRINCAKLRSVHLCVDYRITENGKKYFPQTVIDYFPQTNIH